MRVRKFRMISVIAPVRISSYDGPSVVLGSSIGIVGDDGDGGGGGGGNEDIIL